MANELVVEREKLANEKEKLANEKEVSLKAIEKGLYTTPGGRTDSTTPKLVQYKFMVFDDKKTDIDNFLRKFEIDMTELKYPEVNWTYLLSKSFVGEVPSKICLNQSDYKLVKEQLLRTFGKTEAFYRKQYVDCVLVDNEDPQTFLDRISNNFDNWADCAKIDKTYDKLKTFFILDKLFIQVRKTSRHFY